MIIGMYPKYHQSLTEVKNTCPKENGSYTKISKNELTKTSLLIVLKHPQGMGYLKPWKNGKDESGY